MDKCTYCKEEIKEYNSLEVNGINEICCNKCYDDLYMRAFKQRDLEIKNRDH